MAYTYAFVGLTPSERALLASIFELDAAEGDDLRPVRKPEDAHLLIVNGDDAAAVERLRQINPRALLVLVGRPREANLQHLPVLRRPLDMAGVVRVLSALEWPEQALDSQLPSDFSGTFNPSSLLSSSPPTMPPSAVPTMLPSETMSIPASLSAAADPAAFAPTTATAPLEMMSGLASAMAPAAPAISTDSDSVSARVTWRTAESPAPVEPASTPEATAQDFANLPEGEDADVMVVMGAHGTRRYTLSQGLRRMGYRVRVVEGGERAEQLLQTRTVPCVFLDQASLGDQLMPLVRTLHALKTGAAPAPKLAVIARHDSMVDRLRARMLGCTWMAAPLNRERLAAFFAKQGLRPSR
ncbi:hypothetical protein [Ottowia sp.]|uniref:hypothetical protein n=1 Tax=Ottowia sp. TaxID=1898956 RepID=UPI003A850D26